MYDFFDNKKIILDKLLFVWYICICLGFIVCWLKGIIKEDLIVIGSVCFML